MWLHEILMEKVYGKAAIGYHRTKNLTSIQAITDAGFKRGAGATYGPGVYMTYDLMSQMNDRMVRLYGPYIVRCKVNLDNFLILDHKVAEAVYGYRGVGLLTQFRQNRWTYHPGRYQAKSAMDFLGNYEDELSQRREGWNDRTADIAAILIRYLRGFAGVVFTGEQDGRVIVAYNPSNALPFAYAEAPDPEQYGGGEIEPDPASLPWRRLDPRHLMVTKPRPNDDAFLNVGRFRWMESHDNSFILEDRNGAPILAVKTQPLPDKAERGLWAPNPEPKNDQQEAAVVALANELIRRGVITPTSPFNWSKWYEGNGDVWRDGVHTNIRMIARKMAEEFRARLKPLQAAGAGGEGLTLDYGTVDVEPRYAFDTPEEQLAWMNGYAAAIRGTERETYHASTFITEITMDADPDNRTGEFDFPGGLHVTYHYRGGQFVIAFRSDQ